MALNSTIFKSETNFPVAPLVGGSGLCAEWLSKTNSANLKSYFKWLKWNVSRDLTEVKSGIN